MGLGRYIKLLRRKQASSILVLNFVQESDHYMADRIKAMQGPGSTLHLHHAKMDGREPSPPSLASIKLASASPSRVETVADTEGSSDAQEDVLGCGREAPRVIKVVGHEDMSATNLHDLELMSAGEVGVGARQRTTPSAPLLLSRTSVGLAAAKACSLLRALVFLR